MVGVFKTNATLQIVDLVEPPPHVSRFREDPDNARPAVRFLRHFVDEVRRPVDRGRSA